MDTLGTRIRQLRKSKRLTQDQLGELCGVSKSAISQWEADQTVPETQVLIALRKVLPFNLDWLLSGDGSMISMLDPSRKKLLEVAQTLPEYAVVRLTEEGNTYAQLLKEAAKPRTSNGN